MRALGTVAGVRERAQRVAARIGAAVKRTAYVRSHSALHDAFGRAVCDVAHACPRRLAVVGDGNLWCVLVLANTRRRRMWVLWLTLSVAPLLGNKCREQEHRHGALVGRDSFGNTYYENRRYLTSAAASCCCQSL